MTSCSIHPRLTWMTGSRRYITRRRQTSGTGATELAILTFSLAAARVSDGTRPAAISACIGMSSK
jgi:hypothetical protein